MSTIDQLPPLPGALLPTDLTLVRRGGRTYRLGVTAYTHPASHPPSIIAQDASNRFVTDAEKSTWNGKADGTHSHSFASITGKPTTLGGYGITDAQASIAAGTTAQYFRGDKTWRDFFTDVRAATLTGLSTSSSSDIAASDTVLGAMGKLQGQCKTFVTRTDGRFDGRLGYTNYAGVGGKVTQPTSKSTGVTLHKLSGAIDTHSQELASGATATFVLTNSHINAADAVLVWCRGYAASYHVRSEPGTGYCLIFITNSTAAARTEVVPIQFLVLKGADA